MPKFANRVVSGWAGWVIGGKGEGKGGLMRELTKPHPNNMLTLNSTSTMFYPCQAKIIILVVFGLVVLVDGMGYTWPSYTMGLF